MSLHKSNYYIFESLLSSNALCQSWIAIDKSLHRKVFVKASNPDSKLEAEQAKGVLSASFAIQKHIKCRNILTANRIRREHNNIYVEYPYLDPLQWTPFDLNSYSGSAATLKDLLVSMAVTADFIHIMGYVHGDLKLENFLVRNVNGRLDIKLIDLEFLQESGQPPRHKIFGTPGHIAPEIIKNDIILTKSDNYSLGISLKLQMEKIADGLPAEFEDYIDDLSQEGCLHRPQYILDSLYAYKLIDDDTYQQGLIRVLKLQLKNRFREWGQKLAGKKISLNDFIIRKNNIFGICYDYLDDLSTAGQNRKIQAIKNFFQLLKGSKISRYGEFWQVEIGDELYFKLFSDLDNVMGIKKEILAVNENPGDSDLEGIFKRLEELASRRHNLKARLLIENVMDRIGFKTSSVTVENLAKAYQWLIRILDVNGSFTKAVNYSLEALDVPEFSPELRLEILHNIVRLSIKISDLETATIFVERGIEEARRQGKIDYEFKFGRNRAFMKAVTGHWEKALSDLKVIAERANAAGNNIEQARTHLSLGNIMYSGGRIRTAREEFYKALTLSKSSEKDAPYFIALINMTLICFELGDYQKSIKYGREASTFGDSSGDALQRAGVFSALADTYTRCCNFKEAEFALNSYIYSFGSSGGSSAHRTFYSQMGYMLMNRGLYDAALQKIWNVLGLYKGNESDRLRGIAYRNLAHIMLFRGETESCREYCRKAHEVYAQYNEKAAPLELGLVEILNESRPDCRDRLKSLCRELLDCGASYYAALCLFNILIYEDAPDLIDDPGNQEWLNLIRSQPDVPVFNALDLLINDMLDESRNGVKTIAAFKAVYRVLYKSGQFYWALQVCLQISRKYSKARDYKLAARFLQQAAVVAHDIGDIELEKELKGELDKSSAIDRDDVKLLQSIHRISEILQSMDNVEEALNNLVRLSVDLTGAERGVLLLWDYNAQKYQVKAQIECDDDSLMDIRAFSNNITYSVLDSATPIIIGDAIHDDRTKSHKSIIANNIQSVLCVPIPGHDRINGVLYLDHHTIPSLFEPDDLTYIKSIANFVSTAVTRIWDLKSARAEKHQLQEELKRLGGRHTFITEDPTVRNLLDELKPIAKSNISILLTGESGTGKEILSRMIHDLSPRSKMPFRTMHCPGIPAELAEAILFGIDDRVATNVSGRDGIFTSADGGTLFMDEIADLPPALQAKILRAIEYQEFERVGSNRVIYADIRFVFATNKDLKQLVDDGKFRGDLFYRINKITFKIPPLRQRPSDIPVLIEYFMENSGVSRTNWPRIGEDTMEKMMQYDWPGNVRELKNIVDMFCIRYPGRIIDRSLLPQDMLVGRDDSILESKYLTENREKEKIRKLLIENDWNQAIVARIMKISPATLHRRIKKYRLTRPR